MTPSRIANPFEPTGRRSELARLIGQIQTLTREVQTLRQRWLGAKERTLERLRRQLAAVAKRTTTEELGNAA